MKSDLLTDNKAVFEDKHVVKYFSKYLNGQLNKPEKTILGILEKRLPGMTMLDIGVGTGRTAYHFAQKVKEYIGIDYVENMIKKCQERFKGIDGNISFRLADARKMDDLQSNYFDFILFSFNGLDFIPHEERLQALSEIKRVGKKDGLFCFSSHNLQNNQIFRMNLLKPLSVANYFMLTLLNKDFNKLQHEKYAYIKGTGHMFRLISYFIRPEEQIKQLQASGFRNVRIFDLSDGKEIQSADFYKLNDNYLHYLCEI